MNVIEEFHGFANSIKVADDQCISAKVDGFVLLEVDLSAHRVSSRLLPSSQITEEYAQAEARALAQGDTVVALVSTDSIGGLRDAYPNYFADSTLFSENISAFTWAYEQTMPTGLFGKIFG